MRSLFAELGRQAGLSAASAETPRLHLRYRVSQFCCWCCYRRTGKLCGSTLLLLLLMLMMLMMRVKRLRMEKMLVLLLLLLMMMMTIASAHCAYRDTGHKNRQRLLIASSLYLFAFLNYPLFSVWLNADCWSVQLSAECSFWTDSRFSALLRVQWDRTRHITLIGSAAGR